METLTLALFLYFNILSSSTLLFFRFSNDPIPKTKFGLFLTATIVLWTSFSYYQFITIVCETYLIEVDWAIFLAMASNILFLVFTVQMVSKEIAGFGFIPRERIIPGNYTSERDLEYMVKSGEADSVIDYLKKSSRLEDDEKTFNEIYAIEKRKKRAKNKLKSKEIQHEDYYFEENETDGRLLDLIRKKYK